jgi:hypothetical protein
MKHFFFLISAFLTMIEAFGQHSMSGQVIDINGMVRLEENIELVLHEINSAGVYDTAQVVFADEMGNYQFSDIASGWYIVSATWQQVPQMKYYYGNALTVDWLSADTLVVQNNLKNRNVIIYQPLYFPSPPPDVDTEISGNIRSEDFSSSSIVVNLDRSLRGSGSMGQSDASFQVVTTTLTDQNGYFEFKYMPDGHYKISIQIPGLFTNMDSIGIGLGGETEMNVLVEAQHIGGSNYFEVTVVERPLGLVDKSVLIHFDLNEQIVKIDNRVENLSIFDMKGVRVLEVIDVKYFDFSLVNNLRPGIYIIVAIRGDESQQIKFRMD